MEALEMSSARQSPLPEPTINTHALGKYEFCRRAGIIALESDEPETADEWNLTPRLDYMPEFDAAVLLERRRTAFDNLVRAAITMVVIVLILGIVAIAVNPMLALLLATGTFLLVFYAVMQVKDLWVLTGQLWSLRRSTPVTLGDPADGTQEVSWWGLIRNEQNALSRPAAPYRATDIGLSGRPQYLLTHWATRSPIIAHSTPLNTPRPYHMVRLGAYAHLILSQEVVESVPWGMILNPKTMRVLAVPITGELLKMTQQRLTAFRADLRKLRDTLIPPPPPPPTHCINCQYAKLRRYSRGRTETKLAGRTLHPTVIRGERGQTFHSTCGDRFDWRPLHRAD
jgi:hypothetical protein